MVRNYIVLKTLILISVISYFVYVLFWFLNSIQYIIHLSQGFPYSAPTGLLNNNSFSILVGYIADYTAFIGLTIRIIGATYALISAILILKSQTNIQDLLKTKISKAILFEGLYFLSLTPSIYLLLNVSALIPEANTFLTLQIITQIILISPSLIILSHKLKKHDLNNLSVLKWTNFSALSYILALWGIYFFKWTGMMAEARALGDINWLQSGIRILGLQNSAVTLTLAVIFAFIGIHRILKTKGANKTIKWWGLSLIFLSTHFLIYALFVISVGFWNALMYGELWIITLFGLGTYLLIKK